MGENLRSGRPMRVLLADDHTMFRQGLAGAVYSPGPLYAGNFREPLLRYCPKRGTGNTPIVNLASLRMAK